MNFYREWQNSMYDIEKNREYTKRFLNKDIESIEILNCGTVEELIDFCKFLLKIPINNFIFCIDEDRFCSSDMIVQYSNLNHAIIDVSRILKFSDHAMTYTEIGMELIKAKEADACKKYGENHSKLAKELSMVIFEKKHVTKIFNTAFGNFSVDLSKKDRIEIVKRLILRNDFIQKLIYLSKKGLVNYMDIACETLSESTAKRRKSNVKQLIYLVLENHELLNNIVW